MQSLKISWQWFYRDLKAGELTLLLLALMLAITATSSLQFFSHNIEQRLHDEAARLMAADLVIQSSRAIPRTIYQSAEQHQLKTSEKLTFSSVLIHHDNFQLAGIEAVSNSYPLRGDIQLIHPITHKISTTNRAPESGHIWIDERLIALLSVTQGDTLQLGDRQFLISGILRQQPGLRGDFAMFSPRAMINLTDVPSTGVVQPGSRLQYQLMLTGPDQNLKKFRETLYKNYFTGMRIQSAQNEPRLGKTLLQSQQYFSLAAIMAVFLAGLAIAVSVRRFSERHQDLLALLRSLGASKKETLIRLIGEIAWVLLFALAGGLALGLAIALLLDQLLNGLFPGDTLWFSFWRPFGSAVMISSLLLIGFGSPYLMMLSQTNPIRVLRRDISPTSWSSIAVTLLAVIAITAILMIETKAFTLSASIVVGALLFFTPLYQALTLLLIKIRMHNHSFLLRILLRDPKSLLIQIFSIAIALTALLAVFSLRGELLSAWTTKIPADSPNQFAVNIAPTEVEPFLSALRESNIKTRDVFPIVRGRLTRLNQEPVKEIDRELNLTWQSLPTKDLTLIAGIWWKPNEACQCVSIENSLAERIGIKIGDKLKFDMAEGAILVTVKSIRKVDWNSLQPNFYFIFPPGVIDQFPYTALTSFHIDKNKYHTMARLAQQFPTIVFLDITAMLDSFTSIIQQTAKAVELVLLLTLLGSLLVIISQVVASIDQRRLESALLRVIGISRQKLQQRLFLEFMSIGVAAGLLAAFTNEILAAFIYWKLLELPITLHPLLWWQAPLAGACLTLFSGWLSLRCTWASSPMITLRTP